MHKVDEVIHGFRLINRETINEIEAEALRFRHEKTDADLIVLTNDDTNKVFMIGFRTPPDDDTGVAHILEHSVLNGSRRYPVKEPFAELLKSSLYTFLNAMTYPDRTVYPVASQNDQDFRNLVDVYLDAVFFPLLSRQTFLQEGWHYAIENADSELSYSGVVYNEMLGACSDPENLLFEELGKVLFPDNVYGRASGGDPAAIPELTYDAFCDFHRRFYHPSNSRIFISGNVDIDEQLAHLAEFLDEFDRRDVDSAVDSHPHSDSPVHHDAHYPISPSEDPDNKTFIVRAHRLGTSTDPERHLAHSILARILSGTPASPLRKALVESHLGESTLNYGVENDILDTYYCIGLKGASSDSTAAMEKVIDETLRTLASKGIAPKMVEAAMNTIEFHLREANFGGYPKGLCYGLMMMNSWMYDTDPFMHLRYEEHLATVKSGVAAGGYFERIIRERFIENPHYVTLTLRPDNQLEDTRLQQLREKLAAEKATMSEPTLHAVIAENDELHAAQLRPDTPEALASIPVLPLSAVKREAESFPFTVICDDRDVVVSHSEQPTQGIAYISLAFDASVIPQALLSYLPLFAQLTLQMGTTQRDYVDLTQEIGIHTGGINAHYQCSPILGQDAVVSRLTYSAKALTDNVPVTFELLREIIADCAFEREERLREIVQIAKASMQSQVIPSGHSFAVRRLASYRSRAGWYNEATSGLTQYHFLAALLDELTTNFGAVIERLETIRQALFTRGGIHLHVTGSRRELAACERGLSGITAALPNKRHTAVPYTFLHQPRKEGWSVPSKIQYVGKGANLFEWGYQYHGSFEVLDTLLSRDYLWNKVRVQGGAYGCFTRFDSLVGDFCCVSYRDPNLETTLAAYDNIADHLANLTISDADFEKLIIATMGNIDTPRTPAQKGSIALSRHLSQVTAEEVQRRRSEILNCRKEHAADYIELFRRLAAEGDVCVIGSDEKLGEATSLFDAVQPVFV